MSCQSVYKANNTQASPTMTDTIKTVSTRPNAVVPVYTDTDDEYTYGNNWIEIGISAVCTSDCDYTYPATSAGVSYHPSPDMAAPTFVPPVSLSFASGRGSGGSP